MNHIDHHHSITVIYFNLVIHVFKVFKKEENWKIYCEFHKKLNNTKIMCTCEFKLFFSIDGIAIKDMQMNRKQWGDFYGTKGK